MYAAVRVRVKNENNVSVGPMRVTESRAVGLLCMRERIILKRNLKE
jgi:hypothetical protein